MKILITNDDGINAPGIRVLANFAKTIGDVTVCAPKENQSAKSHSINIHSPFEAKRIDYMPGVTAYAVDSTPADCVRFALLGLSEKYDIVLSGINNGLNIGIDMLYSGTVSAIFEAYAEKTRAIAVSCEPDGLDDAERELKRVYDFFVSNDLLERCPLYNVNIPKRASDIRITRQGGRYYNDRFKSLGNDMYEQHGYSVHEDKKDFTIDTDAALNGHISITPLTIDKTDRASFEFLLNNVK